VNAQDVGCVMRRRKISDNEYFQRKLGLEILPIPDSFKNKYKYFFEDTECPVYKVRFEFSKQWFWFIFSISVFWIFGIHVFMKEGYNAALGGNTRVAKSVIDGLYKERFLKEV